jgi:hypothetical protein
MNNRYELIHAYAPYILSTIKKRAEQHEKDIYHELRELNKLSKTKITQNNTEWKQELRDMLSLKGYQLTYNDLLPDVTNSIIQTLLESGYTTEIIKDLGVQSLIETLQKGHFKDNPKKKLSAEQLKGLQKELVVTIKRFAWAKELDDSAIVVNTSGFDKSAYAEGKMDISIRLPKVKNRRQVRSEVKNYADIFKIGTLDSNYLQPILDTLWFSVNTQTKEIIFHLDEQVIEEQCDAYLMDKYSNFFPFIEDGENILLFSDFIYNLTDSENGSKNIELRNYGAPILTSQPLESEVQKEILEQVRLQGADRKRIAHMLGLSSNKYSLWYSKR